MHKYELMVIFTPTMDDREVSPLLDKFLVVITKAGGTLDNTEHWGRRRLAYEIQKHKEGIYAVVHMTAASADVDEMDRQLSLNENVMRTKVLRAEEAVFSINPIEFTPEKSKKPAPKRSRAGAE